MSIISLPDLIHGKARYSQTSYITQAKEHPLNIPASSPSFIPYLFTRTFSYFQNGPRENSPLSLRKLSQWLIPLTIKIGIPSSPL